MKKAAHGFVSGFFLMVLRFTFQGADHLDPCQVFPAFMLIGIKAAGFCPANLGGTFT